MKHYGALPLSGDPARLRTRARCPLASNRFGFNFRSRVYRPRVVRPPRAQVRNAATLAFAALLVKVCGFINTADSASSKSGGGGTGLRGVTADEFFHRSRDLHRFLLDELAAAGGAFHTLVPIRPRRRG